MIEANQYIFNALANFVKESNIDVPVFYEGKRCIQTNQTEKKWLKELANISELPILPNFKTASFKFEGKGYFVVIGWDTHTEINQEVIDIIDLNAGIVTALLFELKVPVYQKANPYDIANNIFYQSEQEIIKYEFYQIVKFFEPILVYQIQDESPFIDQDIIDIVKLSGFYIIKNSQITSLKFSIPTNYNFEKLFIEGSKNIPYENYKIRNSIVHFRPATEQIKLDDEHWDKLIRASLLVIEYWYKKYNEHLSI